MKGRRSEADRKRKKRFEEIMVEEFLILTKSSTSQIQEAPQIPNTRNINETTPRHIIT